MAISTDPSIAEKEILGSLGFGNESDPVAVLGRASAEQNRELALLGYFGVPGANKGVDWTLFLQYYEDLGPAAGAPSAARAAREGRTQLHNWGLKAEFNTVNIWADYLAKKG